MLTQQLSKPIDETKTLTAPKTETSNVINNVGIQKPKADTILPELNVTSENDLVEREVEHVIEEKSRENESVVESYDLSLEEDLDLIDANGIDSYGELDTESNFDNYSDDTPLIEEPINNDIQSSSITSSNIDKVSKESISPVNITPDPPLQRSSRLDKIAAMKLEVEEDTRKKLMAQMGLNLESITILWENYKKKSSSMSTMTALSNCILDYENKNIKVIVPNASTKGIVIQEHRLMDEIREKFGLQDITLEVNVDPSLFPDIEVEEVNKKLSPREIHQLFAKKNPDFEKLVQILKLKADNGSFS